MGGWVASAGAESVSEKSWRNLAAPAASYLYFAQSCREVLRREGLPMPKMCDCLQVELGQTFGGRSNPGLGPRPQRCTARVLEFKSYFEYNVNVKI